MHKFACSRKDHHVPSKVVRSQHTERVYQQLPSREGEEKGQLTDQEDQRLCSSPTCTGVSEKPRSLRQFEGLNRNAISRISKAA